MSSASVYADTRAACRTAIQAMALKPPAFAWEGFTYLPEQGVAFLEDKLMGAGDTPVSNRAIQHRMSYIVTLKYPANVGTADVEAMAGALLDRFKVGTTLISGTTSVLSLKAERRGAILADPEWLILTVQVTLLAWTLD